MHIDKLFAKALVILLEEKKKHHSIRIDNLKIDISDFYNHCTNKKDQQRCYEQINKLEQEIKEINELQEELKTVF